MLPALKSEPVQKVEVVHSMGKWTDVLISGLNSIFEKITTLSIIPILTLLLLLEKHALIGRFRKAYPNHTRLESITAEINQMVRSFFLGNLIICFLSAVFFFMIFFAIGLENKGVLAFIAGSLTVIPVVGLFACILFPMGQAMLQFNSLGPMITIGISGIVIHFIIANIILPKVIGSRINVNPVAATLGILFWGWTWGAFGVIVAVPMTALIRILLAYFEGTRAFSHLLSEDHRVGEVEPRPLRSRLILDEHSLEISPK
jgi:predicted PurR-regulated permease PerM